MCYFWEISIDAFAVAAGGAWCSTVGAAESVKGPKRVASGSTAYILVLISLLFFMLPAPCTQTDFLVSPVSFRVCSLSVGFFDIR